MVNVHLFDENVTFVAFIDKFRIKLNNNPAVLLLLMLQDMKSGIYLQNLVLSIAFSRRTGYFNLNRNLIDLVSSG